MSKKLWVAMVQHVSVPGCRAALFYQAKEPSDRAIKARFADVAKPAELEVDGVYDLSHECAKDPVNLKAIEAFDDANTRAAWRTSNQSGRSPRDLHRFSSRADSSITPSPCARLRSAWAFFLPWAVRGEHQKCTGRGECQSGTVG